MSFFVVWDNPVHRVMVNWDPPISQVIHLPGGIQKGNTSIYNIQYRYIKNVQYYCICSTRMYVRGLAVKTLTQCVEIPLPYPGTGMLMYPGNHRRYLRIAAGGGRS